MTPYDPTAVPGRLHALQVRARDDAHERSVLADWYEETGAHPLATATRQLHGLYRPDAAAMGTIMTSRPEVARLWRDELPERAHRTRKRVRKMTTAEAAQMPEWVAKWTRIGLSTERADRPMFEAAVAACYRYSELSMPRTIVWAPCPIVVAYAGSIATAVLRRLGQSGDSVGARVDAGVNDSVGASVGARVEDSVRASVNASVGARVDASVNASVGASVGARVEDSVRASVNASVGARVEDSVRASVGASVGASVDAGVGASVDANVGRSVGRSVGDSVDDSVAASVRASGTKDLDQWHLCNGGQFWVGLPWWGSASVSFALDVLRLDIGREQEIRARAYAAALSAACWWWPHRDFVIVSERPTLIEKHSSGKLKEVRWEWIDDRGKHCAWSVRP